MGVVRFHIRVDLEDRDMCQIVLVGDGIQRQYTWFEADGRFDLFFDCGL